MLDHRTAERRSLRYHAVIAERLQRDHSIVARARERAARWLREHSVAEQYAAGWSKVLEKSPDEIAAFLIEDSETARAFRQVSPFAGVLDARERWRLWASEGAADDATAA
jgi:hypothetical protein